MKIGDIVKYHHVNGTDCRAKVVRVNKDGTLDLEIEEPGQDALPAGLERRTFPSVAVEEGTTMCRWSA